MKVKNVVIVGASSGIGKRLAELYAQAGYRVGIVGRRKENLLRTAQEYPTQMVVCPADVCQKDMIENLETLCRKLGNMDLLVYCSGIGELNPKLDFDLERPTIETNVMAFTRIADWAFGYFQQQKSGHFVGISSVGGLRGGKTAPAYNASKAYQMNYLEGLAQKAEHLKIPLYITDIRPGFVDTAMAKGEGLFWIVPVDKAARRIMQGIARRKAVVYVSRRWRYVAALLRLLPGRIYRRM